MSKTTNHSKSIKAAELIQVEFMYRTAKGMSPLTVQDIAGIIEASFPTKAVKPSVLNGGK
jgi:hypothetical protein